MGKYKITVAIPSTKNAWQAITEERYVEAENFNDMLEKALTVVEAKKGARIIHIENYTNIIKKYYFPLKIGLTSGYSMGMWDDYSYHDGKFAVQYSKEIQEAFRDYTDYTEDDEFDMIKYFDDYYSAKEKITSAKWGFEELNGTLYGVVTAKMDVPLTDHEEEEFKEWIIGQNSDGLGEGFEQKEIKVNNGYICVSFWNDGDDYFVRCENEQIN